MPLSGLARPLPNPALDSMDHSNDSWYMINLWENYDEELLERFSREMVVPNYKREGELLTSLELCLNNVHYRITTTK